MSALPTLKNEESSAPDDKHLQLFIARVGKRVRQTREQKGMSRRALSESSGVSQRYLAQLESGSGNISIALLFKVAAAFGRTPDWFLGEDDPWDAEQFELATMLRSASADQKHQILNILNSAGESDDKQSRVCLIGLRGAGKSSLGQILAKQLGFGFQELNDHVEQVSGLAVSEIMALYGQEGYRKLELQGLETVISNNRSVVLAVGGGIVSEPETFSLLLKNFHTIWLKAAPEDHMQRVREQGDERPMAGNPKAMSDLKSILTSRLALYSRANLSVDTSGRALEESAIDLFAAVRGLLANAHK